MRQLFNKIFPPAPYIDRTKEVAEQNKRLAIARANTARRGGMATKIVPANSLSARANRIYSEKGRCIQ